MDPTTDIEYIVNDDGPIADFFTTESSKFALYEAWLAEGNEAQPWV